MYEKETTFILGTITISVFLIVVIKALFWEDMK
jgi:hypothetical protein